MEFTRLSEQLQKSPQSGLIWGAAGTGKTVFLGTAGDDSLFINNGMGGETLKSKWFRETYKSNPFIVDIPFDSPGESKSFGMINDAIESALKDEKIKTICIDDATSFILSSTIRAMEYNLQENKSKTLTAAKKFDFVVPAIQDYDTEIRHTTQYLAWLISECKDAGKSFFMAAHIRRMWDAPRKIGDQPTHKGDVPAFTGADKNPDRIPGLFDYVFFSQAKGAGDKTEYSVKTKGDEMLIAKSRHEKLLPVIWINPDIRVLFKKIEEGGR